MPNLVKGFFKQHSWGFGDRHRVAVNLRKQSRKPVENNSIAGETELGHRAEGPRLKGTGTGR